MGKEDSSEVKEEEKDLEEKVRFSERNPFGLL